MDETTYLITLLDEYWNTAVTALGSEIPSIHRVKPQIMDIRSMDSTRTNGKGGNRVRISSAKETTADGVTPSKDLVVIMEDSQSIEYPTRDWSVRNETYSMSISIRTKQDDRRTNDSGRVSPSGSTFGRDRIENLYKIVRYIIETNRRGWFRTTGTLFQDIKHITFGSRTESNDKKSRIFGYKINVTLKRFSVCL